MLKMIWAGAVIGSAITTISVAPIDRASLASSETAHNAHAATTRLAKQHAATANANTTVITGIVRDAGTNAPIEMAQLLVGKAQSTTSKSDGRYSLELTDTKRGSSTSLVVRRIGYVGRTVSVQLNADTVRLDVQLTRDVNRLSEVIVTGARDERKRDYSTSTAAVSMDLSGTTVTSSSAPTESAPLSGKVAAVQVIGPQQQASKVPATPPVANTPASSAPVPVNGVVIAGRYSSAQATLQANAAATSDRYIRGGEVNREQYDRINDNPFLPVKGNALSTFSIDVDRASYGNVRRFLNNSQQPPKDAVRIEELINYFPYDLDQPRGKDPIAITTEVAPAPWQPNHQLVRIALQARRIDTENLPPNNLVFLIDVSGSMSSPDKLPLVKQSLRLLVNEMRERDRIALVVYAGNAGLVLPSTSAADKATIVQAIERLEAGGSTAGGAGLQLAYRVARENFMRRGNNRVILATDGDFNVGESSDAAMERLIESKRSEGTYLTVLGFGTGNIQDAKMEKLAKTGNGNYAYVDNLNEARKTLVQEMGATLVTVANDVKLQIEFNPSAVSSYRLIGYENRLLQKEDFNNDRKDAGDIGSGHTVTALYEVVPVGNRETDGDVDRLRYVHEPNVNTAPASRELLYVKLRYKKPGESTSKLMTQAVNFSRDGKRTSNDFRFAASVASFGMLLRDSEYKGDASAADVLRMARGAMGDDVGNYRAEFVRLVERWQGIVRVATERN